MGGEGATSQRGRWGRFLRRELNYDVLKSDPKTTEKNMAQAHPGGGGGYSDLVWAGVCG